MKKNTFCLKITALCSVMILISGCETGVKNQARTAAVAPSGIVDKGESGYISTQKNSGNIKVPKIFSNSATPGFYLQVGYFGQTKPNKAYMRRLDNSNFNYMVLDKNGDHYALVGAYYSYNQAKKKMSAVRSTLNSRAFVVQVLRP